MNTRRRLIYLLFALVAISPYAVKAEAPINLVQLFFDSHFPNYLKANAAFPTQNTPTNSPDIAFHQWAWEAYVWATAVDNHGLPRFLQLPTPADLLSQDPQAGTQHPRPLTLSARSLVGKDDPGFTEGASAFVEADGSILIAPNGYPVYASVHMNPSYFATAQQNLVWNGGFTNQPAGATFGVGAAVFKAVWLRLDPKQRVPDGAFTTTAQVPVLTETTNVVYAMTNDEEVVTTNYLIAPTGQFVTVRVALVGLHVVGRTINHPEFVWATFEHKLNTPQTPDNTFNPNSTSKQNYTFYTAKTPFSVVNQPNVPPKLTFDPVTQRFGPVNNAVLENKTGGETLRGAANIAAMNQVGQFFLQILRSGQSQFANYNLIGSVWMGANSYNTNSSSVNALGSVNLANSTAETYEQFNTNTNLALVQNCFSCHSPSSYTFNAAGNATSMPNRLVALSHVLGVGTTNYIVPNLITGSTSITNTLPVPPT